MQHSRDKHNWSGTREEGYKKEVESLLTQLHLNLEIDGANISVESRGTSEHLVTIFDEEKLWYEVYIALRNRKEG